MEWREKLVQNLFNTICKDNSDEKGFLVQGDILYTYGPIDFFTTLDQALQSISQCGQKDVSKNKETCHSHLGNFSAHGTNIICYKTNIDRLHCKLEGRR